VVAFDIETTGLNPYEATVLLVGMKKGRKIKQWKLWEIQDEAELILDVLKSPGFKVEITCKMITFFSTFSKSAYSVK